MDGEDDDQVDELALRRESGGKRATRAKHDERGARRKRGGWAEKHYLERYRKLALERPDDPELVHGWLVKLHGLLLEEASCDPGPPPEQRREQVGRLSSQLTRVVDLAKLSNKLGELERVTEEMGASQVDQGPGSGPRPPAPQR